MNFTTDINVSESSHLKCKKILSLYI